MRNRTIIVAEADFLVGLGIKSLLSEIDPGSNCIVVGSWLVAEQLIRTHAASHLVLDHSIVKTEAINQIRNLTYRFPDLTIQILSNSISKSDFIEYTKIGIKNIVQKCSGFEEYTDAFNALINKKKFYSDVFLNTLFEQRDIESCSRSLTSTEVEIIKRISRGLSTKQIAAEKSVSFHTVNTHKKNIFRKLNVNNVSELILHAIKSGMVDNIEYYI